MKHFECKSMSQAAFAILLWSTFVQVDAAIVNGIIGLNIMVHVA